MEDSIYWELTTISESSLEYCIRMLEGWQFTSRRVLEIINPALKNEISILNKILELKI